MFRTSPPAALAALLVSISVLLSSADARAQAPNEDLTTLEKNLAEEHAALSTSDCATACRALASIRRAADKICALDSGERCAAGRAKADDATRRVREACPECAIASAAPAPHREERAMGKGGARHPADQETIPTAQAAAAPPSESKRGGCAGCATTPMTPGDLAGAALAMTALALVMRRRRPR